MKEMDHYHAVAENLAHIKTLTEHKKSFSRFTAPYFIVWGLVWGLGFAFLQISLSRMTISLTITLAVIGWMATFLLFFKQKRISPVPIFLLNQLKMAGAAVLFMSFLFSFFFTSEILSISIASIALCVLVSTSLLFLFIGIVLGKEIFYMGIFLGVLGCVSYQLLPEYLLIVSSVGGGGSLLATGCLLLGKGKKDEQS